MKLPRMTAGIVPQMGALRARVGRPSAVGEPRYDLLGCTANLGASDRRPGHPTLKHCFAKLRSEAGSDEETLAHGRSGLTEEPYPDVDSVRCRVQARGLTQAQRDRFVAAFAECAGRPYAWGVDDCCSCVETAVRQGLGEEPSDLIRAASRGLRSSPEVVI